jgi:hypothetical protein
VFKNNVIDLGQKRSDKEKANEVEKSARSGTQKKSKDAPILDMTVRREAILNEERRVVRRTILTGFIGAFVVLPQEPNSKANGGLLKIDIYDISENGIAFDIDAEFGHFKKAEEVAMRVYLSQKTYFAFTINIQNSRRLEGEAAFRHGANFVKGTVNDEALFHFVKFIETVSASLERDDGDVMVSNIKK